MSADRTGVVVCGGYATRFGDADEDKATALLAGKPLVRHVADRLASVTDELVVNCRPAQTPALREALTGVGVPLRFAEDPTPGEGPLSGIRTGLDAARYEVGVVVACDMPFVSPDVLGYLCRRRADADAALVQLDSGWFQTTQAVYRRDAMRTAAARALDAGERKIMAAVDRLDDVVVVPEAEVRGREGAYDTFANVNTKAELREAEARLS